MSAELRGASESGESPARSVPSYPPLPADALIIVPVRNLVLFPGMVFPLSVGRPKSIAAAQQAVRDQKQVGILLQRDSETADPSPIDMHRVGTAANIARYVTAPDGSHHLVCQGEQRFQVLEAVVPGRAGPAQPRFGVPQRRQLGGEAGLAPRPLVDHQTRLAEDRQVLGHRLAADRQLGGHLGGRARPP